MAPPLSWRPLTDASLDHVAIAVERWSDAWPRYVLELGGKWVSGGFNTGFAPHQLSFANGARLEILQPWESQSNPFLRRFLDEHGPGPHHLTFKVPDIHEALESVGMAGYEPVGVQLDDDHWKEAFLHPRQALGVVVQLAEAAGSWTAPAPEGFPTAGPPRAAGLRHVAHAVADISAGLRLFRDVLGGRVSGQGAADDGTWSSVDLAWASPMGVRLVAPTAELAATANAETQLAVWLGTRAGRVHHLALSVDASDVRSPLASNQASRGGSTPDAVHGSGGGVAGEGAVGVTSDDGRLLAVVEPPENHGTRLVLLELSEGAPGRVRRIGSL